MGSKCFRIQYIAGIGMSLSWSLMKLILMKLKIARKKIINIC